MAAKILSLLLIFLSLGQSTLESYESSMSLGEDLFLVNRDYPLAASYQPDDLTKVNVKSTGGAMMRKEAALALESMFQAAKDEAGLTLIAVSGYRSYGQQAAIFERKVKSTGKQKAMLLVAPPGASEHQLGLAMDLGSKNNTSLSETFFDTDEGKWVAQNCHRFGFIIRYKAEWTEITGYAYEPWHVRYVGREHAEQITKMDIPLETYVRALREIRFQQLVNEE